MSRDFFDVIVFGGGMVGASAGLGFARKGMKVAIVEPNAPQPFEENDIPDMRVSAISLGSERLLSDLGAWQFLNPDRLRQYKQLSVWEHHSCDTHFYASELNVSHLGHIIENRHLQLAIHQALSRLQDKVTFFTNGKVIDAEKGVCELDGYMSCATLVVAADGGNSQVRKKIGIGSTGWRYQQQVLAIAIETESESVARTFQQFSADGPMAYLPMFANNASLVWYLPTNKAAAFKKLSNEELKAAILQYFPQLHSDFMVTNKVTFPIVRNHANNYFNGRVVLCGDAAHTINPLAGQGVNIGFKDVEKLLALDLSEELLPQLTAYESVRRPENLQMMTFMDAMNLAFSNNNPILKLMRNAGLFMAQRSGPLKSLALKRALGI